jgi:hypothetical protein
MTTLRATPRSRIRPRDAGAAFDKVPRADTAVQQIPGFAVGVNVPTADNARVEEIETFLARPADLPILIADQNGLALVYRDLWRADLDLEWHHALQCACGLLSFNEPRHRLTPSESGHLVRSRHRAAAAIGATIASVNDGNLALRSR